METIKLSEPRYTSSISIEEALNKRRSVRSYKNLPVNVAELSQILWAGQGITDWRGLRTAPSAGALYPLAIYIIAVNVSDVPVGIYQYKPGTHEMVKIVSGDKRSELSNAALGQKPIRAAPMVMVISAVSERTTGKYGERGIRYVHMEAGHAAQNIALQAAALNLGTVMIGAFQDDEVRKIMQMREHEQPLYIIPVGQK